MTSPFPTLNPATGQEWTYDELLTVCQALREHARTSVVLANARSDVIRAIQVLCAETVWLFAAGGVEGLPAIPVYELDLLIRKHLCPDRGENR
jgi:hypothetical protein